MAIKSAYRPKPEPPRRRSPEEGWRFHRRHCAAKAPSRSHVVSAPVSRSAPDSSGNYQHHDVGGSVRLTAQEREFAALSGVSEKEYALGKARLAKEKAAGLRQT